MAFYREFTSSRLTELHLPSLIQILRNQDVTAGVIIGKQSPPDTIYIVKKSTDFTIPQINFIQNAINNAPLITTQIVAKFQADAMSLFEKALLLVIIDQINILRVRAGLEAGTPIQILEAIKDKIDIL